MVVFLRGSTNPPPENWFFSSETWNDRDDDGLKIAIPNEAQQVLSLAVQAHETLLAEGIRSRVVSMPSWEIFEQQPKNYRNSVLPPNVSVRVAVEQASTFGWERYVGDAENVIGMKTFGASAPLKELQRRFGFEPGHVVQAVKRQLVPSR